MPGEAVTSTPPALRAASTVEMSTIGSASVSMAVAATS
jgi:hypothetical protein